MMSQHLINVCLLTAAIVTAAPATTECASATTSSAVPSSTTLPNPNQSSPSNNWAGGIHYDSGNVMRASVDIVVPPCTAGTPNYDYVPYSVSGWAGIDGDSACSSVVLQAGFYCNYIKENNVTTSNYIAWTEWYPAPGHNYKHFELEAGDVLTIDIVAHSPTAGMTRLLNQRTGQKKTTHYKNQTTPLCLGAAEWVIESEFAIDPVSGFAEGERTAGYTPFEFQNATYTTKDGRKHLAEADDMFNMVQNGTEVAKAVYEKPGFFSVVDVTPADFEAGS